jgi:hypothetical protein
MKRILFLLIIIPSALTRAQVPDKIYHPNIHSIKLYKSGEIYSYPVLKLNAPDQLELHFDDLDADAKNYYYSFQLCNADWTPANIQPFDYIRGFQTNYIRSFRYSSISDTRYTHYEAVFPERNSAITRSGNYLLKVFLNDDTSKLAFTRRFLVVDTRTSVSAIVLQPFDSRLFRTHQRVQVSVSTANTQLNIFSPQDIKVMIIQNNVWSDALILDRPSIFRGNYYEYSDEEKTTFAAGQEWRWIDLRSLRLMSERMMKMQDSGKHINVWVKPDGERKQQVYVYYQDLDGIFTLENRDGYNPLWQSDYAYTHFTFVPPGNRPYDGKNVHLFGELTNYALDESSRMTFNTEKGVYEGTLYLKQGYYNYSYVTVPVNPRDGVVSRENTEGNYWGTENNYMALVYFRTFGGRADELIGFTRINSPFQR